MPLTSYAALQKAFTTNTSGAENRARIGEIYRASIKFLAKAKRESLRSPIPNKTYFAFRLGKKLSRAVNSAQFIANADEWTKFDAALRRGSLAKLGPDRIT